MVLEEEVASAHLLLLCKAIEDGDILRFDDIVKRCPANDLNKAIPGTAGATPLILCVQKGQTYALRVLLAQRAVAVNKTDDNGLTALLHAIAMNDSNALSILLGCPAIDVNKGSPLLQAVLDGKVDILSQLLAHRELSQLNAPRGIDGESVIHLAAKRGDVRVLRLLLSEPSLQVNRCRLGGRTAFYMACEANQIAAVKLFLSLSGRSEFDVNQPDDNGCTPLMAAAMAGNVDVCRLLAASPRVDKARADDYGDTPLGRAKNDEVRVALGGVRLGDTLEDEVEEAGNECRCVVA